MFNDTLRANVAYGSLGDASDDAIFEALGRANADEFVRSLPNGLDTELGDNGVLLSGGQRQRIAIARAFLKDAPLLILDEATVGLDLETQYALLKFLRRFSREVYPELSIVAISHDPYVLRYLCQTIFVLNATDGVGTGATIVDQLSLSDIDVGSYRHSHTKMLLGEVS